MRRGTSRSDSWRRSFPKHWPQRRCYYWLAVSSQTSCHQQLYELVSHTQTVSRVSFCRSQHLGIKGNYSLVRRRLEALKVVNDIAERATALMQEYNKTLTKDEEDLKFLIQVIADHCQLYSAANKTELMQSWLMADTENFNKVVLLGRITVLHMHMRSIVIDWVAWSVGLLQWWALQKWLSRSWCCFRLKTQLA